MTAPIFAPVRVLIAVLPQRKVSVSAAASGPVRHP